MYASQHGLKDSLEILVSAGVDINEADQVGDSLFDLMIYGGATACIGSRH